MTTSNFPDGFPNGVTIRGVPITQSQPGKVFWVNGSSVLGGNQKVGGSNGNSGGPYTRPFATIAFAISQCLASRGDVIMVYPGHTETVSAAGSITMNVAGVAVVGLGSGSLRPTITFTTATAATITMSAANCTLKNMIFSAAFADVAECVTPTATGITLEDIDIVDAATDQNFVSVMDTGTTDNTVDDFALINCRWITPDTATTSMCQIDGDIDGLTIQGCYINIGVNGAVAPVITAATGKDLTNLNIKDCEVIRLMTSGPLMVTTDTTTANTGVIKDNTVRHLDVAGEILITAGTNISLTNNLCSAAVDASGFVLPAIDT